MDSKTVIKRILKILRPWRGFHTPLFFLLVPALFFPAATSGETIQRGNRSPLQKTTSETPTLSSLERKPGGTKPKPLPINRPAQITFQTNPILYAAASGDGQWLVYVSEKQGLPELWLKSEDCSKGGIPEPLAIGLGKLWDPAISADGRLVAFTGASYDAKGDIFLIERNSPDPRPRRLTGRETADSAPAFSPDGKTLYFNQSRPGENHRQIMALDLDDPLSPPKALPTNGDAAFPSISPDGTTCAFVSFRDDPGGDIFLMNLTSGKVVRVTEGPERDLHPKWSRDGQVIYFTQLPLVRRIGNSGDRRNPMIFRIKAEGKNRPAYPVTSGSYPACCAMPTADRLYFLSTQKGTRNIWTLPLEGDIPLLKDGKSQLALAEILSSQAPLDIQLAISAFYRVLETNAEDVLLTEAAYRIGRLYEQAGEPEKAVLAYDLAAEISRGQNLESALARIRGEGLKARILWQGAALERQRQRIIENALTTLKTVALDSEQGRTGGTSPTTTGTRYNPLTARILARSKIEQARLLIDLEKGTRPLVQAMGLLDNVIETNGTPRPELAEAFYLKAELFSRIGQGEALLPAYIKIIEQFPDVQDWSDRAVNGVLDVNLSQQDRNQKARIQLLARIAREYKVKLPGLAIGAWNRMGDLYFAAGEWAGAKAAYRQVIEQFPENTAQTAAARLALAEILYREEMFSQALDLYENEMTSRPYQDRLYELAREGYVRKSLAAADFLFALGEVPAAQKIYADLIREDDSLLQAHRGYIKCAAARKQIRKIQEGYRARTVKNPEDTTGLYCLGLSLTYEGDKKSLEEAQALIRKAIEIDGQVAYFHQTSGYISEVLETVYGLPGGLEAAMEAYQKAYFLNDQEKDPVNGANLSLNLGNIHFLLGQFPDAFENYSRRLASGAPFDNEDTEILFYRRLGEAAFQIRERQQPVQAYANALALIEKRIDPRRSSEIAGKMTSRIFDRILTPALKNPDLAEKAQGIALRQTEINRRLFDATGSPRAIPPDPQWDVYRKNMESILSDQENLIRELPSLIPENPSETTDDLLYMSARARDTLRYPEKMVRMKAEMQDRLGLAYQEERQWKPAREAFEKAYVLNEGLGLVENLSVNRRSMAYCAYMEAETLSGNKRKEMLEKAYDGFQLVIALVRKYGVPNRKDENRGLKKKQEKKGLISLDLDISLDSVDTTQAMHGFSRDQEERLAEAFMARIKTELGQLEPAESAIKKQLNHYPVNVPVPDKDLFGVSLLQHRAGHLAYAERKPVVAFGRFDRSAQMSIRMKNPVSAALNMVNMAQTLAAIPQDFSEWMRFYSRFIIRDKETTELLEQFPAVLDPLVIPSYHNALGVYHLALSPEKDASSLTATIRQERAGEMAAIHFLRGIAYLEKGPVSGSRNALALLSALYLNMAEMTVQWDKPDHSRKYLAEALQTAREGLLPRYEWRALAGLGKLKEALVVLSRVPITGAGCGSGEITETFAPLVYGLIDREEAEEAFNLLERLSEIERVHRLKPLVLGHITTREKERLVRTYPRLMEIKRLALNYSKAEKTDKPTLLERLSQEREIAEGEIGANWEQLPSIARISTSEGIREWFVILLGMAFHGEELANRAVEKGAGEEKKKLTEQCNQLVNQVRNAFKKGKSEASKEGNREILCLLGPDPIEAIDLMESLPEGATCLRLIPGRPAGSEKMAFSVTQEDLEVAPFRPDQSPSDPASGSLTIVTLEEPSRLADRTGQPVALSATHLVRSIWNRKPFKRRVLALPSRAGLPEFYTVKDLPKSEVKSQIADALLGENILLFDTPVYLAGTVPTRPGETPLTTMAMGLDQGRAFPLILLSGRIDQVSLIMLPEAPLENAYLLGHLFSLLGAPTLLLPANSGKQSPPVDRFMKALEKTSVNQALRISRELDQGTDKLEQKPSPSTSPGDWMLLGYWGMTPEEATLFAKKHFAQYVKNGIREFNEKHPLKALSLFENALNITDEISAFIKYIPKLHEYSRESAYGAEKFSRAEFHARNLVEILEIEKPDTKEYAQALIKQGLILARMEKYEQSVPALEEGAEILADLELENEQISAVNDLAIVLENATDYDRALLQFETAATLSREWNKQELLARQYMRIGRIYDLRLSSYARARGNYLKAEAIYHTLDQKDNMAHALLDAGRCSRLLGNFQEADKAYKDALAMAENPDPSRLRADILMEKANNAWYQGRYQEAFQLQGQVLALAEQNAWDLEKVMALNTSGLTWWTLGDHTRALRELNKALQKSRGLRVRRDEIATTLNNIGLVYRDMGAFPKALDALNQALAIDREIKSRWAIAYDLKNLGLTYLQMGHPQKALPLFQEALSTAAHIGNRINEAKILLGYGEALILLDREGEAEAHFQKALDLSRSMALRETQWRALYRLAAIRIKQNRKQASKDLLSQAVNIIEEMRAEIKVDQLKDGFITNKMVVYEALISLLLNMEPPTSPEGTEAPVVEAFNVAERSRARNLIDLLGNQRLTLKNSMDQDLYDRQKLLKSRIKEQEMLLASATADAERSVYQQALTRLQDEYADLMLNIQARNPELATIVSVNPVKLEQVQAFLEPGVSLLTYYTLPDEILCWLVTANSIKLFRTPLGRETLGKTVLDFRRMLQNLEPLEKPAEELYTWLLSKAMPELADCRILGIVPHGVLHYLSFATLFDGKDYLTERFPLFYLPSAGVLRYTLERRKSRKSTRVLAVGNPDLKNAALDLPFAEKEIFTIGWNFPEITLLTREKATESWVVDNISDFGIIHLASHGEFDPINPLFSAVKLAPDINNDGDLEASETFGLQIEADLVVLSACQTGLGKITSGDDVIGMNRAFLYAGTHAIISSLWRVSDISTAMLIKQFYRSYKTMNKAKSLQKAMLHVKRRYPHPGYWGAFLLVGDYE